MSTINTPITIILIVLFCALLGAVGQIFFKLSAEKFSFNPLTWFTNTYFIVAIAFYVVGVVLFVWALKQGNVSVLYPIIATSYIWTAIFARVFLNEPFPALKWLGIAFIILGVFLIVK